MRLTEVVSSKTAVFAYGRLNPPTTGHQKLVDKIKNTATQIGGEPMLFLSHSHVWRHYGHARLRAGPKKQNQTIISDF